MKAPIANAVGKRKQDRETAARRPLNLEELGIAVEQADAGGRPVERIEAECGPNIEPVAGVIFENPDRRVFAKGVFVLLVAKAKRHGSISPSGVAVVR